MANETDEDRFAAYGADLAAAVEDALPGWIDRSVRRRLMADSGEGGSGAGSEPELELEALHRRVDASAKLAVAEVGGQLRELLARDVDEQWTNPLSILRTAVSYPTEILTDYGVDRVDRDRQAERLHPDDLYDLTPANFAEFGQRVHECGIRWGAAKAHLHLQRRKST